MELKELLNEISETERNLLRVNRVIDLRDRCGVSLVIAVGNESSNWAHADEEFLYEALLTHKELLTTRLAKLTDAKAVTEKILKGLITD